MNKRKLIPLKIAISTILLATSANAFAGENLIQNGSFESFTVIKEKTRWKRVQLENWVEKTKIRLSGKSATEGSYKVVLDSNKKLNTLSQKVTTLKGINYTLSVDAYAPKRQLMTAKFEIVVDGVVITTITPTVKWNNYSATFVGTGTEQSLMFRELVAENDRKGVQLDNVRLVAETATTVEGALNSGDASQVTADDLLAEARLEIASLRTGDTLLKGLYKNEAVVYDPGNRSQIFNIKGDAGQVFPILQGNGGKTLAVAGTKVNSRFAAFGAPPMEHFKKGNNTSYEPQFKRLLAWLIAANADDALEGNQTIALSFTHSDKADIKAWIASNYPDWTLQECDRNNPDLDTCYNNADLIITGWQSSEDNTALIRNKLEDEVIKGTPILYLHTWYEATNSVAHSIADLLDFKLSYGGNYWAKDKANWGCD